MVSTYLSYQFVPDQHLGCLNTQKTHQQLRAFYVPILGSLRICHHVWYPLEALDCKENGGFSHWHGIRICACLLGHFFAKSGIAIGGGFSSETKEPKLHKLGVFWANYCKKHPIWSKLGALSFENGILMGWEFGKKLI